MAMNSSLPIEKTESGTEKSHQGYQHEDVLGDTQTDDMRIGEIVTDPVVTMESFAHLDERRILAKVTSSLILSLQG